MPRKLNTAMTGAALGAVALAVLSMTLHTLGRLQEEWRDGYAHGACAAAIVIADASLGRLTYGDGTPFALSRDECPSAIKPLLFEPDAPHETERGSRAARIEQCIEANGFDCFEHAIAGNILRVGNSVAGWCLDENLVPVERACPEAM